MDEFARIDQLLKPLTEGAPEALDLLDDAALLPAGGGEVYVVTKDALVEGRHVLTGTPPEILARKALRTNLSDLAAMGADPSFYLLALALGPEQDDAWLARFTRALAEDQKQFDIRLIGGDSVSTTGPVTVSVTAIGRCPKGMALRRGGARVGDQVWVSGTLGDGVLGLEGARGELADCDMGAVAALVERHNRPEPRLALGRGLRGLATACMDLSDGIGGDAAKLCRASGVGMDLEVARFPISGAGQAVLARRPDLEAMAWAGGDDYELLFTAAPDLAGEVRALGRGVGLAVTEIGRVVAGDTASFRTPSGGTVALAGWTHA